MDGWMDRQIDGCMDEQVARYTHEWMDGWGDRQIVN